MVSLQKTITWKMIWTLMEWLQEITWMAMAREQVIITLNDVGKSTSDNLNDSKHMILTWAMAS